MQQLNYPLIIFNNKTIQGNKRKENDLCINTILSFNNGYFKDLVIIDANGCRYEVISYKRTFKYYVFFINMIDAVFTLFLRKQEDYCTWIDFELSEPEHIRFEDVKVEIAKLVNKHPRWFKKSYENFNTIEEDLASYKSLQDMIENIGGYP